MSTPLIADVLCRQPIDAPPEAVMRSLRERFDGISVNSLPWRLDGKRGFALQVDGTSVTVSFEDQPFDLDALTRKIHGAAAGVA